AGYHIEYSSTKFVSFLMGEYAGMVVFGTVLSSVFLGGYNLLPFNWEVLAAQTPGLSTFFNTLGWANSHLGPLWLVLKMVLVVAGYIWIRGTLPRLRYDQLMSLGWKALLPIATFNLMLVALWIAATGAFGAATGWGVSLGALAAGIILYLNIISRERHVGVNLETRTVRMVDYKPEPPRTVEMKEASEAAPAGTV
ncbi:MAG: NADH-quinone oxidoreductase subunit H, partial [Acidocella sp.]|nr:NADH-quinone oxidoreductase subunit H [Acidocella sp.]